jgi:hypothetical protein
MTENQIIAEKDGSLTVNVNAGEVAVAWMSQGGDVSRSADYFVEMGFTDLIPLYTHPVKELTDEEIIAVGNAVVNHIDSNEGWIEFARAILRKAQEK